MLKLNLNLHLPEQGLNMIFPRSSVLPWPISWLKVSLPHSASVT